MPLILLFIRHTGCTYTRTVNCTQTEIFPPNLSLKMRESQQLFFGLRLVRRIFEETQTSPNPNQNIATLWRIFFIKKSAPVIWKKGFYTNRVPKKQEVGGFFVFSGSELWTLLKYSRPKSKTYSGFVLFKAYPMILLSGWSNLAGRYL